MEKEVWKIIEEFPRYEVSDLGRVRSNIGKQKTLSLCAGRGGYVDIRLRSKKKTRKQRIHRLVLLAFVGPCPEGHETSHEDGCKTNNRLDNLKWATLAENEAMKHLHGTANYKLNPDKVRDIRSRSKAGESYYSMAKIFGVDGRTIRGVVLREHWKHVA